MSMLDRWVWLFVAAERRPELANCEAKSTGVVSPGQIRRPRCPRSYIFELWLSVRTANRTYWKATLRSAPLLEAVLLGKWHEEIRVFRWRVFARIIAYRHRRTPVVGLIKDAVVDAYSPGANVFPLNEALASRTLDH
jgi:hypothetical protein